jgi:glycosyltransferase involved in cell wall biosynthesis
MSGRCELENHDGEPENHDSEPENQDSGPPMRSIVHVVLPNDIDDSANPTGGNVYDRRVCRGLAGHGWTVREHAVAGAWPHPAPADRNRLARLLCALPDGAVTLLDGLIASAVPELLEPHQRRLRLVLLVHMAFGTEQERAAVATAAAVVTTSEWSRQRLLDRYPLPADRVVAAPPGVDAAPASAGSPVGEELLCVAAIAPHKGHDVLVRALSGVRDLPWHVTCVGSLDRDPGFVADLRQAAREDGLTDRIRFTGPLVGPALQARYAAADLLVLPSLGESYGMVVTEALARAIPVLTTAIDGLPEAVGRAPDGSRPALLVPPGDPVALADAVRRWLSEPELRDRLRSSARERRTTLSDWTVTSTIVSEVLSATSGAGAGR